MARFQCKVCNFKFEAQNIPKECPYCSRIGTVGPVPQVSDLLQEIEEDEKKSLRKMREEDK